MSDKNFKNMVAYEKKKSKIRNEDFKDAKEQERALKAAKKYSNNGRKTGNEFAKLEQEKAIKTHERRKARNKLHGPGFKDGGGVQKRGKGCEKKGRH